MRIFTLLLILVVGLCSCPKQAGQGATGTESTGVLGAEGGPRQLMAVVCSATESDPWSHELVSAIGNSLGIDPWSKPSTDGHLDVYGPYQAELDGRGIEVVFALTGLTSVVGVAGQDALGEQAHAWLTKLEPAVVWLDGDQAQFNIGMKIDPVTPIVFTGVELDYGLYYGGGHVVTGILKRHSLSRALEEIWRVDTDARNFALVTDGSPMGRARLKEFKGYERALPEGHALLVQDPVESWSDIIEMAAGFPDDIDGVIYCGVGLEEAGDDLMNNPCPDDLLLQLKVPAVVLGPSRMDQCGAVVLTIKPAAHVPLALERVGKMLMGVPANQLPVTIPDAMSAFRVEKEKPGTGDGE